jgi:DNA primase
LGSTAVLCFDSDEEGVNGRNKAIKKILALMNVEVIKLEEYKDVADIESKDIFVEFYKKRDKL